MELNNEVNVTEESAELNEQVANEPEAVKGNDATPENDIFDLGRFGQKAVDGIALEIGMLFVLMILAPAVKWGTNKAVKAVADLHEKNKKKREEKKKAEKIHVVEEN